MTVRRVCSRSESAGESGGGCGPRTPHVREPGGEVGVRRLVPQLEQGREGGAEVGERVEPELAAGGDHRVEHGGCPPTNRWGRSKSSILPMSSLLRATAWSD